MNVFQATDYFGQFSSIDFQSIESLWVEPIIVNSQSLTSDDETISAFEVLKVTKLIFPLNF